MVSQPGIKLARHLSLGSACCPPSVLQMGRFVSHQGTDEEPKPCSPSVILRQARYKATTEAVSKTVATKLPSILASVPLQITWEDIK